MLIFVILVFIALFVVVGFCYNDRIYSILFFNIKRNKLSFLREYTDHGDYGMDSGFYNESLNKIIKKFKNFELVNNDKVAIKSKFNNIHYPIFDLDDLEMLEIFKTLYSDESYAIFKSSDEHFWAFLDAPHKNTKDIFYNTNWKICNDQKYVTFSIGNKNLIVRGLYENKKRKPYLFEKNGILSKNFQLFIDKLSIYYNKEGLELSLLRYKDPELLFQFNRKIKLEQLNAIK